MRLWSTNMRGNRADDLKTTVGSSFGTRTDRTVPSAVSVTVRSASQPPTVSDRAGAGARRLARTRVSAWGGRHQQPPWETRRLSL